MQTPPDNNEFSPPPAGNEQIGDLEKTLFQVVVSVGEQIFRPYPKGFKTEQEAEAAAQYLLSTENGDRDRYGLDADTACVFICRVISCYGKKMTVARLF